MSVEEFLATTAKKSRYGNVKRTPTDGLNFDSAGEADRWLQLKAAEERGFIKDLRRQVAYDIIIGGVPVIYESGRKMRYYADFVYLDIETGTEVIEDWKMTRHRTDSYKIKKALMRAMGYTITEKSER